MSTTAYEASSEERPRRSVMIFGAGVAGLTAAHELISRGFDVEVVDPNIQERIHSFTLDRGIGGMARSQWGCRLQPDAAKEGRFVELADGRRFLIDDVLMFKRDATGNVLEDVEDDVLKADMVSRAVRLLEDGVGQRLEIRAPRPSISPEEMNDDEKLKKIIDADPRVTAIRRALNDAWPGHQDEVDNLPVFIDPFALDVRGVSPPDARWLFFTIRDLDIYAGEHGFRFFPSFYRHVFDTFRRIPIHHPRPHERTHATVLDNLIPSEGLGFARSGKSKSFLVPRRPINSIEEARRYLMLVLRELEYEIEDIQRFTSKLLKYMTSSVARRRAEYEDLSWGKFVEQERFSRVAREHVEFGPQMSAALRGSLSDCRTQGTISTQLFMDQIRSGRPDCTLNAPTNGAWLDHWHAHLFGQGVKFRRGTLAGFERSGPDRVSPKVYFGTAPHGLDETHAKLVTPRRDFYVFALSLPAAVTIAEKMLKVTPTAGTADNDLTRIISFGGGGSQQLAKDLKRALPKGALQHLSGVQFYFDNGIDFWRGHTQYLDSAWGLTSIAQPQFWGRPRDRTNPYRGILSVDIGIWNREFASKDGTFKKTAWSSTAKEIALYAWEQIEDHHDDAFRARYGAPVPRPVAYKLDTNIRFETDGTKTDDTPFLVNRTSQYPRRPGRLIDGTHPDHHPQRPRHGRLHQPHVSKDVSFYDVHFGQYVFAGTFMKTYTRLTSMESANESARLAVNAILKISKTDAELCEIWDPEDNELDDLAWLRELDERRLKDDRPHMMDTLDDLDGPFVFPLDRCI